MWIIANLRDGIQVEIASKDKMWIVRWHVNTCGKLKYGLLRDLNLRFHFHYLEEQRPIVTYPGSVKAKARRLKTLQQTTVR